LAQDIIFKKKESKNVVVAEWPRLLPISSSRTQSYKQILVLKKVKISFGFLDGVLRHLRSGVSDSNWLEGHILEKNAPRATIYKKKAFCGPQYTREALKIS
jgi:hypothetical protein